MPSLIRQRPRGSQSQGSISLPRSGSSSSCNENATTAQLMSSLSSIVTKLQFNSELKASPSVKVVNKNLSNKRWCRAGSGRGCRCGADKDASMSDDKILMMSESSNNEEADRQQDFSYLKKDLSADNGEGTEEDQPCKDDLITIEALVQNLQERVDNISGQPEGNDCHTKEEVHRLKRYIRELCCMISCIEHGRDKPYGLHSAGKQSKLVRQCSHHGRHLQQSRDRLADLKNKYEQNLLITPTDVNWPFVHLIASNQPQTINESSEDCCDE